MSASSTYGSSQAPIPRKSGDYFDLDNILLTQTAVPTLVISDIHGLGFLDPSGQDEEDLKRGAKLDLPLWLAEPLTRKTMVTLELPKTHGKAIREELTTDASHVSLAQNPYIYELGNVLTELTGDSELPSILSATFASRFPALWDKSRNWREDDTSAATSTMCHSERKLFTRGYASTLDYQNWSHRKEEPISAAPVIKAISKNRKRPRPI